MFKCFFACRLGQPVQLIYCQSDALICYSTAYLIKGRARPRTYTSVVGLGKIGKWTLSPKLKLKRIDDDEHIFIYVNGHAVPPHYFPMYTDSWIHTYVM